MVPPQGPGPLPGSQSEDFRQGKARILLMQGQHFLEEIQVLIAGQGVGPQGQGHPGPGQSREIGKARTGENIRPGAQDHGGAPAGQDFPVLRRKPQAMDCQDVFTQKAYTVQINHRLNNNSQTRLARCDR